MPKFFLNLFKKVKNKPFKYILHKGSRKILRELQHLSQFSYDRVRGTYHNSSLICSELKTLLEPLPLDKLSLYSRELRWLTDQYLLHRFDVLGSGWVQVKYGMKCSGIEGYKYDMGLPVVTDTGGKWLNSRINKSNLEGARRRWTLISEDYIPIDWHLDFKSGYRWNEKTWYHQIAFGHLEGAEVKVPWELARMQHLPQLALAFALAKNMEQGFQEPVCYSREFQNQMLDFMATNPPRYGVNWKTAMDVSIRAINWLIAYDLFSLYGAEFCPGFKEIFKQSVYDHFIYIKNNLEWHEEYRGNHYLANIAGLIFISTYWDSTAEMNGVLRFAIQQLIVELEKQFYEEGTNFEGSTCYHRLSGEMVIYTTALILGLDKDKLNGLNDISQTEIFANKICNAEGKLELYNVNNLETPFPHWYFSRLERIAEFTINITKPNGLVPQIGDNDSGRLLKITPLYNNLTVREAKSKLANLKNYFGLQDEVTYLDEEFLNHSHLVASINGLIRRKDFQDFTGVDYLDYYLVKGLAKNRYFYSNYTDSRVEPMVADKEHQEFGMLVQENPERTRRYTYKTGTTVFKALQYPQFGLYIFKAENSYMAINCKEGYSNPYFGHMHNDQLSLEFVLNGKEVHCDPGTYLYTSIPSMRNRYRSIDAHSGPIKGLELADLEENVFTLKIKTMCKCLYFGNDGFLGVLRYPGLEVWRSIAIKYGMIEIVDLYKGKYDLELLKASSDIPYSAGYGKRRYTNNEDFKDK